MQVIHCPIPPFLQQFIKAIWIVEEDVGIDIKVNCFPVGYPFINVISGSKFVLDSHHQKEMSVRSYLAGPFNSPFVLNMSLINRALTIQFLPQAIPRFFGLSAYSFKNLLVALEDVDAEMTEALESEVASEENSVSVLNNCLNILHCHCKNKVEDNQRIEFLVEELLRAKGDLKINDLAYSSNLSIRRLQQLFKDSFGMSPKMYSRIIKMQYHSYQLLHGKNLDAIIPDGYYDQSHFIHELKRQTNMLPSEYAGYINDPAKKQAYLSSNLFHLS